jgi:HAD superfamily hydrolase (TIGR01509 family)
MNISRKATIPAADGMVKAILWDNDGVLVDTERLFFAATRQVLAGVGVSFTKEMYCEFSLVQGRGPWHLAEERGCSAQDIGRLKNQRNILYSKLLSREPVRIEGAGEILKALCGKYVMGIVTSSRKDHFDLIHRSSGLLQYVDFVLTGDDYTNYKPHPEPYLLAVEKSGCKKTECLAVEDSERGLTAAVRAGIRCVVIPNALTRNGNFADAEKVLKNIGEVLTVL